MKRLKIWGGRYSSNLIQEYYKKNNPSRGHIVQGRALVKAYTKKQAMEFLPSLAYSELTNYFSETGNKEELEFCKNKIGAWLFLGDWSDSLTLIHTFHEEEIEENGEN